MTAPDGARGPGAAPTVVAAGRVWVWAGGAVPDDGALAEVLYAVRVLVAQGDAPAAEGLLRGHGWVTSAASGPAQPHDER